MKDGVLTAVAVQAALHVVLCAHAQATAQPNA